MNFETENFNWIFTTIKKKIDKNAWKTTQLSITYDSVQL